MKGKKRPEEGDIVIGTIKNVNPNSAFVRLEEYPMEGMIHISEIASSWVRDIRKMVKPGQVVIVKVLPDRSRHLLSLSLKRVKTTQRRERLDEWKNAKKAVHLLGFAAKKLGVKPEELAGTVARPLEEEHGSVYEGFKAIASGTSLEEYGVPKKTASVVEELVRKRIKPKEVVVKGKFVLSTTAPGGIDDIRKVLSIKREGVTIRYISAPEYSVKVVGKNYPDCETALAAAASEVTEAMKGLGGSAEFVRE